jgi:hemerythrin
LQSTSNGWRRGLSTKSNRLRKVCDDSACKLGQWLYGAGKCFAELPAYADLLKVHQRFHDVACGYVNVMQSDSLEHLKQETEADFKITSVQVVASIERLKLAAEREHQPIGYATQFHDPASSHPTLWDESLALGLTAIDEQHKAISAICDKLMKSPDESAHSEFSVDCLTDLGKIMAMHFAVEEAYMQQFGMVHVEFEAHRKRHGEILDQYVEMNNASYMDRDLKVGDIALQVREWTIDHLLEYDFNIKKYLPA